MIAGRLHWKERRVTADGRRVSAAFHFDNGTLTLTEVARRSGGKLNLLSLIPGELMC